MMKSPYPIEQTLGMQYYAGDTQGTGGFLRRSAEDFIVNEVENEAENKEGGKYLICRLTKKNWELQRAVREISRHLGISHRRIAWAGTKDKHAITTQLISIYDIEPEDLERVHLKDISLEAVRKSQAALSLGELQGNRFEITIRDCMPEDLDARVDAACMTAAEGIPNFYGIQRFGVIRPVTHLVGEAMLQGDLEEAVAIYVGLASKDEPEETYNARQHFSESRDALEALNQIPVHLHYERSMLHHLVEKPGDYEGALLNIPPKLISMFVGAFQSWLFNKTLSMRMEEGYGLTEPINGDRLIFTNGREDIVTPQNISTAAVHMKRGRCSVAIMMPGSEPLKTHGPMDEYILGLMGEHQITPEDFARVSELIRTRFRGARRPIALKTDIERVITGTDVKLSFTLPPGHYATTVCREIMKADPLAMI